MSEDLIRYDVLLQEALRGVVRRVLSEVQRTGLPGEHHFFIQFDTNAPGVRISSRLKEQYPDEMTVVVQHQFWELVVHESNFEVGLSFGGVPEKLTIPFASIRGFFDPSVQFGLQIDPDAEMGDQALATAREENNVAAAALAPSEPLQSDSTELVPDAPEAAGNAVEQGIDEDPTSSKENDGEDESAESSGADVVSLDAFRKRT